MTKFRPCIDLHHGQVKQIVGSSLRDEPAGSSVKENFTSDKDASWYAGRYALDRLVGGHMIKLGPGNDQAARAALAAYPQGLQLGGSVTLENAMDWLNAGASHVIVTSWLFNGGGKFNSDRPARLARAIGRDRIVIDLSCKRVRNGWRVAMNRWQTLTDLTLDHQTLDRLAAWCSEFLIHAADVEGLCGGIDRDLVELLGQWNKRPITYAGGIASMDDIHLVSELSGGHIDVTVGSALDLFGGTGIAYQDLLKFNGLNSNG